MDRIKRVFTIIHFALWILFSLLVALQASNDVVNWPAVTTGVVLTCLYVFYSHFYILTLKFSEKEKWGYFLKLAAIFFTGPIPFMFFHPEGFEDPSIYSMTLITAVPIFLFLGWLARITENLVLNTVRKEQLEKQAVEAELYYLKSQINPHFLFNTLNNIHTLVYKQAPTAPEAVHRLASLMRYMVYESNAALVPLSREVEYLQDYIGLQQLRYKNSPVVDLKIEGDTTACHIAPLLFIHLLENAYKHSPARLEPEALKVSLSIKENNLTFRIQNPIGRNPGNALEEPGGIGLPNVRKRLALLYPDNHKLEVDCTAEVFTVTLHIKDLQLQANERETHLLYN